MRPHCDPIATLMRPQSYPKATFVLLTNSLQIPGLVALDRNVRAPGLAAPTAFVGKKGLAPVLPSGLKWPYASRSTGFTRQIQTIRG